MPLGGIGTGSIWLDGQGRLAIWQIFNNLNERRVPTASSPSVPSSGRRRRSPACSRPRARATLQPVASLDYEGGYPIARLDVPRSGTAGAGELEAMNPMIPLDAANSSIPCAVPAHRAQLGHGGGRGRPAGRAAKCHWQRRGRQCPRCPSGRLRREP